MLAKCDSYGLVRASVPAMAHLCMVPIERLEQILAILTSPDPYSRSADDDGRRLNPIDGGWLIVNYVKYRDLLQTKPQSHAERQRKYRERLTERDKRVTGDGTTSRDVTRDAEAEAEAEVEVRAKDESPIGDSSPAAPPTDGGDAGSDDHGDDPPGCPPCPIEKIVAEYHHALPMLARVRVLPEQARKMLRARWREDSQRQTVGWWTEFFEFVRDQNPFLVGGKTDFQADLLWLVRPTNFAKVVNGNYQARRA